MIRSKKTAIITVQNVPVTILNLDQQEYISLTDMAKARTDSSRAADVIKNWLRTRSTLEFLGTWEV
ncbi:KilA-N domain-containing protein, partial [Oscillibacter sp. CU971]|uniref:KilA-N domain-containing protein n=1 Tax=Oscillibacter sp. CU971 TaxID=2780102 RepID=UPI00195EBCAB